jgi:hypothetical protein
MKKFLAILVLGLLFCNIGFAEMRLIEEKRRLHGRDINWNIMTVCIDGYKFVIAAQQYPVQGSTPSMVQFYERAGGVSLPAKC